MATLKDFREERLRKLKQLKGLGLNPYPADAKRTHNTIDIIDNFEDLIDQKVTVSGRIVSIRKFGKLAFIVFKDFTGQIQLFLRSDVVEGLDAGKNQIGIAQLPLLDTGDFIEATGSVIKTKTGEISIETVNLAPVSLLYCLALIVRFEVPDKSSEGVVIAPLLLPEAILMLPEV